jgi:hypothetical protein
MTCLFSRNRTVGSLAALACAFVAFPASAQEGGACLRDRYTLSTKVHDSNTIIVTDRSRAQYTVNLTGICAGLSTSSQFINLHPKRGGINCVQRGDEVSFSMPGDTRVSGVCLVDTVEEGTPAEG